MTTILWFRRDLRLADNPALAAALAKDEPIIPLFILDDEDAGEFAPKGASRWWLHGSLAALGETLRRRGTRLILRRGRAEAVLGGLLRESGASGVYWNRSYEPWASSQDERLSRLCAARGTEARSFNGGLIHEPRTLRTQQGKPYRVFTPFWKAMRTTHIGEGTPAPTGRLPAPDTFPQSDELSTWALRARQPGWAAGLQAVWKPGEQGARERLHAFIDRVGLDYNDTRDIPSLEGTSRLSPHLHFGEIGPRQIWRALSAQAPGWIEEPAAGGVEAFLSEVGWREFSHHLLFHFPMLPREPLREQFRGFPWANDPAGRSAWERGTTGYPIVDAGMRELWTTGWMHNRARMIVASFLVKDLLIDWRDGAAWFWDTLVDADLANNSTNWQWVAGCGTDAAPYFRVFNPSLQGAKFDPDGAYVRHWVPELAQLPTRFLHAPWTARPVDLTEGGVTLGKTYPRPIVEHSAARARALAAFKTLRTERLSRTGSDPREARRRKRGYRH